MWKSNRLLRNSAGYAVAILLLSALLLAQESSPPQNSSPEVPIKLGDRVVFLLQHSLGGVSVEERATLINARLERLVKDRNASPDDFEVGEDRITGAAFVRHKRYKGILFSISTEDAGERIPLSVATEYAERLESALRDIRAQQQQAEQKKRLRVLRLEYARAALLAIVYTLALPIVWVILRRTIRFVDARLQANPYCQTGIRWQGVEVLSADRVAVLVARLLLLEHLVVFGALIAVYLHLMLVAFPPTRPYSDILWRAATQATSQIGNALLGAIPGLINIIIIVIVARLVFRGFVLIIERAESGAISLEPYVPHEFLRPTRSLGKFLITLIALFFIAPNIPGAGSDFAKLVTVLIGVIVSFSSTTTIGNFLAGIVLAYMRPFRRGDRVKIGDVVGDVIDSSFLHTRLRTPKKEEVLVPSMQILGGTVVNYSSAPEGVILYTRVSIGYDTPRTRVEQLLLEAARGTEGCEQQPPPFVLVRSLDDSFITYELNVYTRRPNEMEAIYSNLHRNIKDVFDSAGVEIMSPHYVALRDGNRVTIPDPEQ